MIHQTYNDNYEPKPNWWGIIIIVIIAIILIITL